nr:hypothetical protein [uncultured Acidocella sp.]
MKRNRRGRFTGLAESLAADGGMLGWAPPAAMSRDLEKRLFFQRSGISQPLNPSGDVSPITAPLAGAFA